MASAPSPRQNSAFSSSLTTAIDAGAERVPELHRGDAAPARGPEHDQLVAGRDPAAVDEPDPAGEVRDPEAGGLGGGEAVGHCERAVGRTARHSSANEPLPPMNDVTHMMWSPSAQPLDTLAQRGDHPGRLLTRGERERRREGVGAPAHEHVGEPEAGGGHPDAHLAGTRLRRLALDQVEHLGRLAGRLHLPRPHPLPRRSRLRRHGVPSRITP